MRIRFDAAKRCFRIDDLRARELAALSTAFQTMLYVPTSQLCRAVALVMAKALDTIVTQIVDGEHFPQVQALIKTDDNDEQPACKFGPGGDYTSEWPEGHDGEQGIETDD